MYLSTTSMPLGNIVVTNALLIEQVSGIGKVGSRIIVQLGLIRHFTYRPPKFLTAAEPVAISTDV